MSRDRRDTIVVGAGAGGLTVAVGLARLGRRVALVEADQVGGDCTNVGCIPSKTLIEAARRGSGLPASERTAAAREALVEARRRRDAVRDHEEAWLADMDGVELVRGRARLASARRGRVEVDVEAPDGDARRLWAPRVVLAPGSHAWVPTVPGLEDAGAPSSPALTNATVFDLASPPAHLLVLGAGAIGCELAFAFARLGSRVTLVEAADRVLPASEPAASEVVRGRLDALGVRVLVATRIEGFDPAAGTARLAAVADGAGRTVDPPPVADVDRVLVAVGRRPATRDLGLEDVGVEVDDRGRIRVDGGYRTTAPGVYAIGDAIGGAFTHVANAQGRRLVRRLVLPIPLTSEGDHPWLAFTEPEVGQIGPTLAELRRRLPEPLLAVHRVDLADTDRGGTMGLRDGFVQLVAMRGTGRLLAATVVAPNASEMLPLLASAQRRGTSLWRLSRLEVAYPALSEAIQAAADAFLFASLPRLPREVGAYLRWRGARRARR